jgi:6,7-dimethyl-8-ribityllumazine synthase
MQEYEGVLRGDHLRVCVIASRFNETISRRLLEGALDQLRRHGVRDDDLSTAWVPGAFELPLAAHRIGSSGEVDAIVCVGAVIRGETPHFDFVAGEAASGLQLAAIETGVPVSFGVLTCETVEQAQARVERAADATRSALEMADLFSQLRSSAQAR